MSKSLATKNVAAILVAVALVLGFAFAFATPAKADTLSDLQKQVQALLAQIASLQGGASASTGSGCFTFTQNLKQGSKGGEVMQVQKFLNGHGFAVAASGAGSAGNETSSFGPATKAAVIKFQNANAASILTPVGLTAGTGYWGPSTRAAANAACSGTVTPGPTPTPSGPGVSISAGAQPANSLAPQGASRVPFTSFTLTNNTGSTVTIKGITVQRTGLAQDAAFSGVVLVDNSGFQVGVSRTFDANHQATVGDTFTLNPGQSVSYTVAANMGSSISGYAGQVASISVIGVNTSVPVSGSLPISGAQQTINSTLTTGSVTAAISSFDPNSAQTKHIGDTGIRFTGVRLTAASTEDVKLYSIRFRLNGTISPNDVGNLVGVVSGTSYPASWSSDGRYATVAIPGGVLIAKGNSSDVYLQGDLTGSGSAGRVVEFDVDKTSDIYMVGQLYGYGILPTPSNTGSISTSSTHATAILSTNQPWFQGSTVTIQAGTATTIQNAVSVPAQNVALNTPNQVLGGFDTNFSGEAVTVQGLTIAVSTSSATGNGLTSVSIVDSNGAVVAGPVDENSAGNLVYTNSVTFPTGTHTYTIKGKVDSNAANGSTIQLSTNPSSTWTSPQGQTSGNSITISIGNFTMNTMTVRGASLAISMSATPASQTVVAGAQNFVFANVQLDATQSGDDIRLSSLPLSVAGTYTTDSSLLSNCGLWNGTTLLTSGSNIKNTVANGSNTFTFDNPFTASKGTVPTLTLSCNVSSSATSTATFAWSVPAASTITSVTAVNSGNSVTSSTGLTTNTTPSGTMTVASAATITVASDPSSPSEVPAAGGTTGVTLGVVKFRPANEGVSLTKVGLTLTRGTYTGASGAQDIFQVKLYNGATQIGTAVFAGNATTATSTLSSSLSLPVNVDTLVTLKADLSDVGAGQPGTEGDVVVLDVANYEGTGLSSGSAIRGGNSGGLTTNSGVRLFNTFPTVAQGTLPSTGAGSLAAGKMIRFAITADSHGPVGIYKFAFQISTSTSVQISTVGLYGYTDSGYSVPISGQGASGLIGSTFNASNTNVVPVVVTSGSSPVEVPAGSTYYFELRGSPAGFTTGSSITTTLLGDSATTSMAAATSVAGNFVWSPNATTTTVSTVADWNNGALVVGLPSGGLTQSVTQ